MSQQSFRALWLVLLVAHTVLSAWLSVRNNDSGGRMFWPMFLVGQAPIWWWISSRSDRIVFDGMLYDSTQALVYAMVMGFLARAPMSPTNWAGAALAVLGLVLLRR